MNWHGPKSNASAYQVLDGEGNPLTGVIVSKTSQEDASSQSMPCPEGAMTLHDEILAQQAAALANGRTITYTEAKEEIHKAWDRERILELLNRLTDEERLNIFTEYCRACGKKDPKCQCWNDE